MKGRRETVEFRRCYYNLAFPGETRRVEGWAVQLPAPFARLRFCVRRDGAGRWCADHFDSGLGMVGPVVSVTAVLTPALRRALERAHASTRSRAACARWLYEELLRRQGDGSLRASFHAVGYRWCLDEAGV